MALLPPHTRPLGPKGTPFELADAIRVALRRSELDVRQIAEQARVDLDIVYRIRRRMRQREKRAAKRERAAG